jgi:hypothetical protein
MHSTGLNPLLVYFKEKCHEIFHLGFFVKKISPGKEKGISNTFEYTVQLFVLPSVFSNRDSNRINR